VFHAVHGHADLDDVGFKLADLLPCVDDDMISELEVVDHGCGTALIEMAITGVLNTRVNRPLKRKGLLTTDKS
jgi:hypothetical protein